MTSFPFSIAVSEPHRRPVRIAAAGRLLIWLLCLFAADLFSSYEAPAEEASDSVRIATFNVSLNRRTAGALATDLAAGDAQAEHVAWILRTVRPDIVLLNEFDYEPDGEAIELFQTHYLQSADLPGNTEPLILPFVWSAPVNTGLPAGVDVNGDGRIQGPADCHGFGWFPGQFGMVLLSRFPPVPDEIRTFQRVLWSSMPDARRPVDPASGRFWHSENVWHSLRLSSKSHWDVPVLIGNSRLHLLASHPTPPAFDGPEDRNGCRNADEIRFWTDYLDPTRSTWIRDDSGHQGGLTDTAWFCLLGDLNADPADGASQPDAIRQLLTHPRIAEYPAPRSAGAAEAAEVQKGKNRSHRGPAACDTADFSDRSVGNLRVDYVLPCRGLQVIAAGVYWPASGHAGADKVTCSDHRLVWIDVRLPDATEDH